MNDFNQQLSLSGAATTYSDVYQLPSDVGHVEASVNLSALAGTSPTLAVTVQTSQDKVTWEDRNVLPTFSATGTKKIRATEPKVYVRFKLVLAGTTPTATVTLFAIGREGEGDASETFALQQAAAATGDGNVLDVIGQAAAVIALTGTFVGTVTFEATLNGSTWFSIMAVKLGDGSIATTATSTGLYRISCAGLTSLRARVSAYTSGSITATGRTSQNDSGAYDALFARLIEKLGGEDVGRDLMKTIEDYPSTRITTATTTPCLAGSGSLGGVFVEAALTGTVTIYDHPSAASGTVKCILPIGTPAGFHKLPFALSLGATAVTSAADRVIVFAKS